MTAPPIPDSWSPQQALAVYRFLNDLREHIWTRYGPGIQQLDAADRTTDRDTCQLDLFDTDTPLPF